MKKEDQAAALSVTWNSLTLSPIRCRPIIGVTLALEEESINGAAIDDAAIQGL